MTFVKAQSGNPAGRPDGARNRKSLVAEALLDGDAEGLSQRAIELALRGDPAAMRLCFERILPRGRERPLPFPLPEVRSSADIPVAANRILEGVGAGEIMPAEAQTLIGLRLPTVERQGAPIHAAFHAAIDAALQSDDVTFPPAVLRELSPNPHQRHGIGLGARLKVTILASEVVAGKAQRRVGHRRADLVRGIRDERMAIFDEPAERVVAERRDIGRRPACEVDRGDLGSAAAAERQRASDQDNAT